MRFGKKRWSLFVEEFGKTVYLNVEFQSKMNTKIGGDFFGWLEQSH